jgi:hypothetical protein
MAEVLDWKAVTADGKVLNREPQQSVIHISGALPDGTVEAIKQMNVLTDHLTMPLVQVEVDPWVGQTMRVFTRRSATLGADGASMSIPVMEIIPDPAHPERFVRLYLYPSGPVISTIDRYPA